MDPVNAELQVLSQDEQELVLDAMYAEYLQAMMALCYPQDQQDDTYTYA